MHLTDKKLLTMEIMAAGMLMQLCFIPTFVLTIKRCVDESMWALMMLKRLKTPLL